MGDNKPKHFHSKLSVVLYEEKTPMIETLLFKPMSTHPRVHSVWPRNRQNQSGISLDQQISLIFEEVGNQLLLKPMEKFLFSK